jgi:hypothetical protein
MKSASHLGIDFCLLTSFHCFCFPFLFYRRTHHRVFSVWEMCICLLCAGSWHKTLITIFYRQHRHFCSCSYIYIPWLISIPNESRSIVQTHFYHSVGEGKSWRGKVRSFEVSKSPISGTVVTYAAAKKTKRKQKKKTTHISLCLHAGFLICLFFEPEDEGDMFLRKVGWLATGSTALYPRRQNSSILALWELQILHLCSSKYINDFTS